MNKARITYRFDAGKERGAGGVRETAGDDTGKVIPLYQEEYHVEEEREDDSQRESAANRSRPGTPYDTEEPFAYGNERRQRQERDIRDYQGLNQFTTDFGAWSSPFDAETQRIEELIRQSDRRNPREPGTRGPEGGRPRHAREFAADPGEFQEWREPQHGEPQPERAPHWPEEGEDMPTRRYSVPPGPYRPPQYEEDRRYREEPDDMWEGPVVTGPRYVRHNRIPWLKISASIAGAAITGVLLGVLVLSLFNGFGDGDTVAGTEQDITGTTDQNAQPVNGTVGGTINASGNQVGLAYAGKTYSFLQHGLFSVQQGADQAKADLVQQGLAAASEQADRFYVFAGMAMDKESAKNLSQKLKEQYQLDIYVKDYDIPAVEAISWSGNGDTLKSYLEQSDKLLQSINLLSVMNLESDSPAPLDDSTLQSVSQAHSAWSQTANTVAQEAGDAHKALVQRMNSAMTSAKASLDEYKKNPSAAMLWQAQTYTLQFVIAQKELLTQIGV